ncbi:MAG: hypothetical protein HC945_01195 [Nitrosarchaeum sp.]|nr:hypothetical protein [Nitrosarchaeum sp.]
MTLGHLLVSLSVALATQQPLETPLSPPEPQPLKTVHPPYTAVLPGLPKLYTCGIEDVLEPLPSYGRTQNHARRTTGPVQRDYR